MEPISRTNISKSIVDQVVDLIASGEYRPGQRLPSERELMETLGVGRSSIREAFQALAIMGLIDIRPGQGTFVREITTDVIIRSNVFAPLLTPEATGELVEARLAVEPTIAALAAQRHTEEELSAVDDILSHCERALASGEPVYSLSASFHLLIARASHNTVFIRFMETLATLMAARGARIEEHTDFIHWELESHRTVRDAVAARDGDAARKVMEEHIIESSRFYFEVGGV
ncbi:MAG: FadR family transcriptional regulator [Deltaproteobacteria bacterium]|nr:FadR family transcriptional regulator [Candidatus Zymogenaceae bacterium]